MPLFIPVCMLQLVSLESYIELRTQIQPNYTLAFSKKSNVEITQ